MDDDLLRLVERLPRAKHFHEENEDLFYVTMPVQ